MSQEKVDRYKEQKRNRKAIQAKKKRGISHKALCRTDCNCTGRMAWIFCDV